MATSLSQQVCDKLKARLQTAEAHAHEALAESPPDHRLADATKELLAVHTEIRDLLLESFDGTAGAPGNEPPEIDHAAIEIEREEHTMKADFKDVLKALFLWKDDPNLRVKSDAKSGL